MNDTESEILLIKCVMYGIILSMIGLIICFVGYIMHNIDVQYYGIGWGIGTLLVSLIACIILLKRSYK